LDYGIGKPSVSFFWGTVRSKTTENYYAPWVKARQEQLELSDKKIWAVQ
jgi:hypothetical protein